jgi:hypothetical protein
MFQNDNALFEDGVLLEGYDDENKPWNKPLFSLDRVKNQSNFLAGKVLTLIDAAITDPIQRKAIKDRMKQDFYAFHEWFLDTPEYSELIDAHNEAKHYANLMNERAK